MTGIPAPLPLVLEGGCFGWLHRPAGGGRPRRGAVLCSAIGFEEARTHRSWRVLAERLAAQGVAVLRFDYAGTGDSAGEFGAAEALERWIQDIGTAVARLRADSGATEIALVGLRLGALLAAEAAAAHAVDRLALLAPVSSGRAHARELKLIAESWRTDMLPSSVAPPDPAAGLNVVGDHWSPALLAALGRHDLRKLSRRPAPEVLILEPEGRDEAPLSQHLTALGATVTRQPFPGFDKFMREEVVPQPPDAAFAAIAQWVAAGSPDRATSWAADRATAPAGGDAPAGTAALVLPEGCETPVRFGPAAEGSGNAAAGGLFGMLCEPAVPDPAHPAVLLLNTGSTPHAGGGRLGVALCRRLAAGGTASLRLDLSGLGDSDDLPGRGPTPLYDLAARADVAAAVDLLQRRGHREVIVAGLCSGAYLGFHAALEDPRIVGAALVNLQQFIWQEGTPMNFGGRLTRRSTDFYLRNALRPHHLARFLRGEVDALGIVNAIARRAAMRLWRQAGDVAERWLGVETEAGQVRRWVAALSRRGTAVALWYGPEDRGLATLAVHCGALGATLRDLPGIEVALLDQADHVVSFQAGREQFLRRLEGFVREVAARRPAAPMRFAAAGVAPRPGVARSILRPVAAPAPALPDRAA